MKVTECSSTRLLLKEPPFEGEVPSLERLTFAPWMERWWAAPGFYQFSRTFDSQARGPSYLLLAEFDGGKRYYVVARLEGADLEEKTRALPLWKGPLKK